MSAYLTTNPIEMLSLSTSTIEKTIQRFKEANDTQAVQLMIRNENIAIVVCNEHKNCTCGCVAFNNKKGQWITIHEFKEHEGAKKKKVPKVRNV
jgi:hypothetical protein